MIWSRPVRFGPSRTGPFWFSLQYSRGNPMRTYRLVIAFLAFTALTACTHGRMEARPFVAKEAQPASSSGYVGALTSKATMVRFGFGLREESTHEDYVLAFQEDGVS